jgi:hypothetical protein
MDLSALPWVVPTLPSRQMFLSSNALVLLSQKVAAFADEESSIWQT